MLTEDTPVADKAIAGKVGMATAAEGLGRVW